MPNIYITTNHFNKDSGISPWRYIGSDQYDNSDYFGSSEDLKKDIENIGKEFFSKELLFSVDSMDNKELRLLESTYLQKHNVKLDNTYYNKSDLYAPGGGAKGMKHSKKFARSEKWKESRRGWNPSDGTRELWSTQRSGILVADFTKEKMTKAKEGSKNHNALTWEITLPSGETVMVTGLAKWCRDNGIPFSRVYEQHMGYKLKKFGAGKGGPRKLNESN